MSIKCLFSTVKKKLAKPKRRGLIEYATEHKKFSFWLRPSNDAQSHQMVGGYLKAVKDELQNGGYIFVRRSKAASLLRQLTEMEVAHNPVSLPDMSGLSRILNLHEPKGLWVIIEDDGLPYSELAARHRTAETLIRGQMAPPLGQRIEKMTHAEIMASSAAIKRKVIMFIEIDCPSIKGFAVVQSQCKSLGISVCHVTRECVYDRKLHGILNEPEHIETELNVRAANSVLIFGPGDKYQPEMNDRLDQLGKLVGGDVANNAVDADHTKIDLESLSNENYKALAFGFSVAEIIDIDR